MRLLTVTIVAGAAAAVVAGCATGPSKAELDAQAQAVMKASFRPQGIAGIDRIDQDLGQSACSSDKLPPDDVVRKVQTQALESIRWPAGDRYIGDWQRGERLAQSGRGMTWSDASADPKSNGGNCYNCHELSKQEISFGTIGPSLHHYGKARGVKDPNDPVSLGVVKYTWSKLYNAKSYNACTTMPRFGHMKVLDEDQLRDIMALLLDPKSPVNQ